MLLCAAACNATVREEERAGQGLAGLVLCVCGGNGERERERERFDSLYEK